MEPKTEPKPPHLQSDKQEMAQQGTGRDVAARLLKPMLSRVDTETTRYLSRDAGSDLILTQSLV